MVVLSLFDGMSCGQIALRKIGIKVDKYLASEVDKYAIKVTQKNYPDTIQIGSIVNIRYKDGILYTENGNYDVGKIDIIMGGSPCQDLSFAGSMSGLKSPDLDTYLKLKEQGFDFKGQSYLFWEYLRLLREVNPTYFLLENVRMTKHWKNVISENLCVEAIEIDSRYFTAQKRKRLYWTNIKVDNYKDKNILLKDIMLDENSPLLEIKHPSEKRIEYIKRKIEKGWLKKIYNDESTEKSECLLASMYKQLQEFIWKPVNGNLRFFSVIEFERLQTVPDNYTEGVSNTQRLKMLGNGWTVDVIAHIFKNLNKNEV